MKRVTKMRRRKDESGYTLMEVIVAVAVLTFGLLAVASMQVSAIRGNSFAWDKTEATNWAGDRIEKLMRSGYNDLLSLDADGDGTDQDADGDGADDDGGNFGLDDDAADTADFHEASPDGVYDLYMNVAVGHPRADILSVRVIIRWNDRGEAKRFFLDFIKSAV